MSYDLSGRLITCTDDGGANPAIGSRVYDFATGDNYAGGQAKHSKGKASVPARAPYLHGVNPLTGYDAPGNLNHKSDVSSLNYHYDANGKQTSGL